MHKKLASDLTSLAHSILQMKNKEDVLLLKEKAYEVYEKLSVLAYVDEYINTTPNAEETKDDLLAKIEGVENKRKELSSNKKASFIEEEKLEVENEIIEDNLESSNDKKEDAVVNLIDEEKKVIVANDEVKTPEIIEDVTQNKENIVSVEVKENQLVPDIKEAEENKIEAVKNIEETIVKAETTEKEVVEEIIEQPFDEIENLLFNDIDTTKKDVKDVGERKTPTLEEELQDTLPVDVMANLFEKVDPKKSLNDHLQNTIQIGLNDRIAFVKHLFEGNQNDFNRVISQLNTCKTEKEAKKFINKLVKPDYNWSDKEEYETRLLEIIERRFA
ncbi:hypothetical protein DS884_08750 [Tenacibaculum sp. E3R01]|uniref:hypothetical protein n=1 Tax=Tenacibaculum sp. E3R01 TaxID=2267227 RepID=UPI000DEA086D|nr:hypothetical protein [Tenacibaculum sp. E3R01]RBW59805.1 hypothetical protein DS884_08750 [Tenacibaculum sp. E3R01]